MSAHQRRKHIQVFNNNNQNPTPTPSPPHNFLMDTPNLISQVHKRLHKLAYPTACRSWCVHMGAIIKDNPISGRHVGNGLAIIFFYFFLGGGVSYRYFKNQIKSNQIILFYP